MYQIENTNLWVGGMADLSSICASQWAIVHATQTIHYPVCGWNRTTNKPNKDHPDYLTKDLGQRLSINWVDGPAHLYKMGGPQLFVKVLDFIDKWYKQKNVLVHCDQGISRSPTVVLLYLAKRLKILSSGSFNEAVDPFKKLYPSYNPGGIAEFVSENWDQIT